MDSWLDRALDHWAGKVVWLLLVLGLVVAGVMFGSNEFVPPPWPFKDSLG